MAKDLRSAIAESMARTEVKKTPAEPIEVSVSNNVEKRLSLIFWPEKEMEVKKERARQAVLRLAQSG